MDWSPIPISMNTPARQFLITFLLGIFAARAVVFLKMRGGWRLFWDGADLRWCFRLRWLRFSLLIYIWGQNARWGQFLLTISVQDCIFLAATVIVAGHVLPLMYRSARGVRTGGPEP